MNKKLIAILILFFQISSACAQASSNTGENSPQPDQQSAFESITALNDRVSRLLQGYFTALEVLATDDVLIAAVKDGNNVKLDEIAANLRSRLEGSLKVRLFIRDEEEIRSDAPACGFTCIEIARAAYEGKPDAEALLFLTADANIAVALGIQDASGQAIGAIMAHYPYSQLKNEVGKLPVNAVFTEIHQLVSGSPVVLFSHGDKAIKQGTAQKIVRIPQSRWAIAVWTPGGVALETYEPSAIPWMYVALLAIVLLMSIAVLVIYRAKRSGKPARKISGNATDSATTDVKTSPRDRPTVIMGGGAKNVNVSQYLKDSDITEFKNKFK